MRAEAQQGGTQRILTAVASNPGRLDLLVPALLARLMPPLPEAALRASRLEWILGRADRLPSAGDDPLRVLFERFGVARDRDRDIPSAPFSRLADAPEAPRDGFWLHADPVHLRADRDRLLLFDSRPLGLEQAEADALVDLFNGHFAADSRVLEAPVSTRWYLRVPSLPAMVTRPLHAVVGRGIESMLPQGPDAAEWNRLLNEAQMLFFQSEVNRRREREGRPLVNGIWVWGGGCLSEVQSDLDAVYARHPLARGLAIVAGIGLHPLSDLEVPLRTNGSALVFWDRLWRLALDADGAAWAREVEVLDDLLCGLVRMIGRSGLSEINVFPCDGTRFRVTRLSLRRFWRRRFALSQPAVAEAP